MMTCRIAAGLFSLLWGCGQVQCPEASEDLGSWEVRANDQVSAVQFPPDECGAVGAAHIGLLPHGIVTFSKHATTDHAIVVDLFGAAESQHCASGLLALTINHDSLKFGFNSEHAVIRRAVYPNAIGDVVSLEVSSLDECQVTVSAHTLFESP